MRKGLNISEDLPHARILDASLHVIVTTILQGMSLVFYFRNMRKQSASMLKYIQVLKEGAWIGNQVFGTQYSASLNQQCLALGVLV